MLQAFAVAPDLAPWVEGAVVVRLAAGQGPSRFPAMPQAMLTVRLLRPAGQAAEVLCPPITIHAPSTVPTRHAHACDLTALGLVLRPEAAVVLMGVTGAAGAARVDTVLPWAALAGPDEAARAEEALDQAADAAGRLSALADSVRRALARQARGDDLAQAQRLCTQVGRLGAQAGDGLGLGQRQLERRCQALIGMTPRTFQRLVRLNAALSLALHDPGGFSGAGAALALEAGYCDQSHLGRDLRRLAGAPLGALLASARPDGPGWALASHRLMRLRDARR